MEFIHSIMIAEQMSENPAHGLEALWSAGNMLKVCNRLYMYSVIDQNVNARG